MTPIYYCDSKDIAKGTRLFSREQFCPQDSLNWWYHNEFKVCSVHCTLSLVVKNTLGTAKILGLKLPRTIFLKTVIVPFQNKSEHYLSAYVLSA